MADSLREALVSAMEVAGETAPVEAPAPVETAPESEETTEQTAQRARDEAGRFSKDAKNSTAQPAAPAATTLPPVPPAAAVEPAKAPTSWKKEYWEKFAALPPDVQKYIGEREGQFASGVSTYKQEAERAKEIYSALQPYSDDLQRYNITFPQWIQQVGTVHQTLAKGTVEEKLRTLSQLLPSYNVPARLAIQDAQGNWQLLDTGKLPQQQAPQQQQFQPQDIEKIVEQKLEQRTMLSDIEKFSQSHPHYEAVRSQMAGLLQAGMAENLDDAYDKALRINPELYAAEQQRIATEKAAQAKQEQAARVAKARSSAVSPRSDTPSGSMTGDGKKGLRSNLVDAFDAIEEGRV